MNRITIIGNLTRDPVMGTTQSGKSVCNFTVAVNRRKKQDGTQEADFFQVHAWNELGNACAQYLSKGKKVAVIGQVSVSTYNGNDGTVHGNIDVLAQEVEFLTPRSDGAQNTASYSYSNDSNTPAASPAPTPVDMADDELPF